MKTKFEMRMMAAAVVLMVMAVIAGLVLAARPGHEETRGSSPVTVVGSAPGGDHAGLVVVGVLDESSAADAASGFVRSTGEAAVAGPLTRRDVLLSIATEEYGPQLVESVNRDLDDLLAALGERGLTSEDLLWAEFPLTVSATLDRDGHANVQVWSVLVLGVDGGSVARQLWRTSNLILEADRNTWKVAGWTTTTGPSPVLSGEADVATVAAVDEKAGWTRAGGGR